MTAQTAATFGIEIEFKSLMDAGLIAERIATDANVDCRYERYNHQNRTWWKITTDASVRGGWELVSPILPYTQESFDDITRICSALQALGAHIDKQCGLHVHHGAAGMSDAQIAKVVAIYAKFETTIDGMMPQSRRSAAHVLLKSLKVRDSWKESVKSINACKTREQLLAVIPDRYYKVNPWSLLRHGTIEFRHHSGTIEAHKILNWVHMTKAIVERGATTKHVSIRDDRPDPNLFRGIIGKELAGYFRDRTRQLAA